MKTLDKIQLELVAIGAAIGSNCIPCIHFHIAEAKRVGLDTDQLREALASAESVSKTSAGKVRDAAKRALGEELAEAPAQGGCCGAPDSALEFE